MLLLKGTVPFAYTFLLFPQVDSQPSYRYDGLYIVEKVKGSWRLRSFHLYPRQAWMEKGLNPQGFKVCKFAFKVCPDGRTMG